MEGLRVESSEMKKKASRGFVFAAVASVVLVLLYLGINYGAKEASGVFHEISVEAKAWMDIPLQEAKIKHLLPFVFFWFLLK